MTDAPAPEDLYYTDSLIIFRFFQRAGGLLPAGGIWVELENALEGGGGEGVIGGVIEGVDAIIFGCV